MYSIRATDDVRRSTALLLPTTYDGRRTTLLFRRLAIRRRSLVVLQHGPVAGSPRRQYRQRNRRDHKDHRAPGRRLSQDGCRATRAKCRLAAHAAERSGDVATLAALQQHHDNQESANKDVNNREKNHHTRL